MKSERNQKSRERKSEIRRTGNQIKLCYRELCPVFFARFFVLMMSCLNQRSKGLKERFSVFLGSFCPLLGPVRVLAFNEIVFSKWFDASFIIVAMKQRTVPFTSYDAENSSAIGL